MAAVGDELLVLAGPVGDTDATDAAPGAYSVYRWDPRLPDPASADEMKPLFDIPTFTHGSDDDPDKPEAILPLAVGEGSIEVLVLFDGPDEGAPRAFPFGW
jgi:hypothetical protein